MSIEDALQLHMTNELLDDFQDPEKKIKVLYILLFLF